MRSRGAARGRRTRPRAAAGARAPAAPGRRQPLPSRHRRRRLARHRDAIDRGRRGRRPPDRADRLRPARRPVGGRRGARRTTRWWPAWRCTPTRRRASPPRGGSRRRWPRSSGWPGRTTRSARSGRPGSTTSGPGRTGAPAQVESFVRHIDLAKRLDKTLVIHDRDAHDEVLDVHRRRGRARALGDALLLRQPPLRPRLPRPGRLPVASPARSRSRTPSRCATRCWSRRVDRVLVETDAPFLTPTPYRGRPNASYLVPVTMRAMAEVRGDDLADAVRGHRRQHRARLRGGLVSARTGGFRTRDADHER